MTPSSRQMSVQPRSGCHCEPSVPRCLFGSNAVDGPVDGRPSPFSSLSAPNSIVPQLTNHTLSTLQIGTVQCLGCAGTVDRIWCPLYGLRLSAGTRNLDNLLFRGRSRLRLHYWEHFKLLPPPVLSHLLHLPRLDPGNGQQQQQPNSEFRVLPGRVHGHRRFGGPRQRHGERPCIPSRRR